MDGGVDLLLIETFFDTLNAKVAIGAWCAVDEALYSATDPQSTLLYQCLFECRFADEMGQYNEIVKQVVSQMADFIAEGLVNIIGGCCGTNDHFIEKLTLLTKENTA